LPHLNIFISAPRIHEKGQLLKNSSESHVNIEAVVSKMFMHTNVLAPLKELSYAVKADRSSLKFNPPPTARDLRSNSWIKDIATDGICHRPHSHNASFHAQICVSLPTQTRKILLGERNESHPLKKRGGNALFCTLAFFNEAGGKKTHMSRPPLVTPADCKVRRALHKNLRDFLTLQSRLIIGGGK